MLSMRALECLVIIVEQGSLTKAAAALHMSQPAWSHQIAAVEREVVLIILVGKQHASPSAHPAERNVFNEHACGVGPRDQR